MQDISTKFDIAEKFKAKNYDLAHFNKIVKQVSKTQERPYPRWGDIGGLPRIQAHGYKYTIEDVTNALDNLSLVEMRRISRYFYNTSTSYRRQIDHFAQLYKYYYVVDFKRAAQTKKKNTLLKIYNETLDFLDSINIRDIFGYITQKVLVDGAFFGYVNEFDDNKITITQLNPNYCRSRDTSAYGTACVEFNVQYFARYQDKTDLEKHLSDDVACFYIEQPNYYGLLEDTTVLGNIVHEKGAKYIIGCNPISLGLISTPKEANADIAVGEGQSLGLSLNFGGPYFGFMASTKELMRRLPGRIVGQTTDSKGQRGFVLTLQAREQHIRREKASSSICSNQSLCALRSAMYMSYVGPIGLKEISKRCFDLAHYAFNEIIKLDGFSAKYNGEFFHEFVIKSQVSIDEINNKLDKNNILGGLALSDNEMLVCVTEANTIEEIDLLVKLLKEVSL